MGKDAARLKTFLGHLPQTDRYILLLHQADGLTVAEIALVLDLPARRVEARLNALRAEARAVLSPAVGATTQSTHAAAVVAV